MAHTYGNLGITTGILLILFILIGAVAGSVLINESQDVSDTDLTTITNESLDEITTYLQIKNVVGKYEILQNTQSIQKIAILVKPLVSTEIDFSKMTIMISDTHDLRVLYFNGTTAPLHGSSLFSHPLWDLLQADTYGVIPTMDDDASMEQYHIMNKNTDTAFIILKLPENDTFTYGESMQLTLIPTPGIERTLTLEPPIPKTGVVTLY